MPTYRIHHLTRYTYDQPVSVCHNLAHLLPRDSLRHSWRHADVEVSPNPAVRADRIDYFGNRLTFFAIQEPHRELDVTMRSTVDLEPASSQTLFSPAPIPWELVRNRINLPIHSHNANRNDGSFRSADGNAGSANHDLLDAFQFTFASPYIRWTPEVADYAAVSFPPNRPILDAVINLTTRIYKDFKYDTKTTNVSTTLPEIMAAKSGVCQDFAHLQIGCLRSLGLAARYVSGYLLTAPPPGKPRLIGADASHAWLSVYIPDLGWIDVDPTNNVLPNDKHITLAWGRDFGDVSPLRGVILGGGRHHIHVSVDVSPIG